MASVQRMEMVSASTGREHSAQMPSGHGNILAWLVEFKGEPLKKETPKSNPPYKRKHQSQTERAATGQLGPLSNSRQGLQKAPFAVSQRLL